MSKPFKELRDKMSPERRARAAQKAVDALTMVDWLFVPVTRLLPTEPAMRERVTAMLWELANKYGGDGEFGDGAEEYPRLALIKKALKRPDTSVQAYPGTEDPEHWHVYLFSPKLDGAHGAPLFVGVVTIEALDTVS